MVSLRSLPRLSLNDIGCYRSFAGVSGYGQALRHTQLSGKTRGNGPQRYIRKGRLEIFLQSYGDWVRRILTWQSKDSPTSTKTDEPPVWTPAASPERRPQRWKGRQYTIQIPGQWYYPNIFLKRSEYRLDSGHWKKKNFKEKKFTHKTIICPRGELRKRSQLGIFQLHRPSPTGHIKYDSTT